MSDNLAFLEFLSFLFEEADGWLLLVFLLPTLALVSAVVDPFYTAGGFGIYIQRRIEREGWDLELKFRQLAGRLAKGATRISSVLVGVFLTGLLAAPVLPVAHALEGAQQETQHIAARGSIPVEDPTAELEAILDAPPFGGQTEIVTEWRRKEEPAEEEIWEPGRSWEVLAKTIAEGVRFLLWALAILFGVWALSKLYGMGRGDEGARADLSARSRWEEEFFDEGGESPDLSGDVTEAVGNYWRQGEHRQALAVLLMTSLIRFEERHKFVFPVGWTAARCAREVRQRGKEGRVLSLVAKSFERVAWAGRSVSEDHFQELLRKWREAFEQAGGGHEG